MFRRGNVNGPANMQRSVNWLVQGTGGMASFEQVKWLVKGREGMTSLEQD